MLEHRKRRSSVIPFGWQLSDDGPGLLEPVQEEQQALKEALGYVQMDCSLRETARWLSAVTGRYLSDKGLKLIYDQQRHDGG